MPPVSDIVRDSKLETEFCSGYTQHAYSRAGATLSQRRIRTEERWVRERLLGTGGYGTVWLEKLITGNEEGTNRAVKVIRKPVDYSREIEAIAKFSHPKVRESFCFLLCLSLLVRLLLSRKSLKAHQGIVRNVLREGTWMV